jgi:hypothetical protein
VPVPRQHTVPGLLKVALKTGTIEARIELGVAVMAKKENERSGTKGKWYVARAIPAQRTLTVWCAVRALSERFERDHVRRIWGGQPRRGSRIPNIQSRRAVWPRRGFGRCLRALRRGVRGLRQSLLLQRTLVVVARRSEAPPEHGTDDYSSSFYRRGDRSILSRAGGTVVKSLTF